MTEEARCDIGGKIGRVIEVDKRSWQADRAKFMRVRIDLPIEKPLRRGGYVTNMDGERCWASFKYERLPTFCFTYGKIGHDEKHYDMVMEKQPTERQYGEWLRAGSTSKGTNEGSRGSGSGSHEPKNSGESGKTHQATVGEMVVSVQSVTEKNSSLGGRVNLEGMEKFENLKKKGHDAWSGMDATSYQSGWDFLGAKKQEESKGKEPRSTQRLTKSHLVSELSNVHEAQYEGARGHQST
nr:hypothetical protein CFP56_51352 [Quercus suber]